jgi:hypothetical protein
MPRQLGAAASPVHRLRRRAVTQIAVPPAAISTVPKGTSHSAGEPPVAGSGAGAGVAEVVAVGVGVGVGVGLGVGVGAAAVHTFATRTWTGVVAEPALIVTGLPVITGVSQDPPSPGCGVRSVTAHDAPTGAW